MALNDAPSERSSKAPRGVTRVERSPAATRSIAPESSEIGRDISRASPVASTTASATSPRHTPATTRPRTRRWTSTVTAS